MIVGIGQASIDDHDKYHIYDGWSGIFTLLIRLGMFAYYIVGIKKSMNEASERVQEFLIKFGIYGSIYFLAFPVLALISNICDAYIRNYITILGGLLFQTIAIIFIIYLNSSKNSSYYKNSTKSHSLLPNG